MKRYIICTWTVITCRCVPNFLYPFLKGKTFRSFPFLTLCKLCNYKYGWWLNLGYYCLDNIPWQLLQQYSMTIATWGVEVYHWMNSGHELKQCQNLGELIQKPWRIAAYWFAPSGLLSLLSYRNQDLLPRNDPIHNGLSHPQLITH